MSQVCSFNVSDPIFTITEFSIHIGLVFLLFFTLFIFLYGPYLTQQLNNKIFTAANSINTLLDDQETKIIRILKSILEKIDTALLEAYKKKIGIDSTGKPLIIPPPPVTPTVTPTVTPLITPTVNNTPSSSTAPEPEPNESFTDTAIFDLVTLQKAFTELQAAKKQSEIDTAAATVSSAAAATAQKAADDAEALSKQTVNATNTGDATIKKNTALLANAKSVIDTNTKNASALLVVSKQAIADTLAAEAVVYAQKKAYEIDEMTELIGTVPYLYDSSDVITTVWNNSDFKEEALIDEIIKSKSIHYTEMKSKANCLIYTKYKSNFDTTIKSLKSKLDLGNVLKIKKGAPLQKPMFLKNPLNNMTAFAIFSVFLILFLIFGFFVRDFFFSYTGRGYIFLEIFIVVFPVFIFTSGITLLLMTFLTPKIVMISDNDLFNYFINAINKL
uniref:Uncharacterized protein n=1 Tax=viral metagenome TaxID=1070528 RepID=A0A6C0CQZ9_9ZZZZ